MKRAISILSHPILPCCFSFGVLGWFSADAYRDGSTVRLFWFALIGLLLFGMATVAAYFDNDLQESLDRFLLESGDEESA